MLQSSQSNSLKEGHWKLISIIFFFGHRMLKHFIQMIAQVFFFFLLLCDERAQLKCFACSMAT